MGKLSILGLLLVWLAGFVFGTFSSAYAQMPMTINATPIQNGTKVMLVINKLNNADTYKLSRQGPDALNEIQLPDLGANTVGDQLQYVDPDDIDSTRSMLAPGHYIYNVTALVSGSILGKGKAEVDLNRTGGGSSGSLNIELSADSNNNVTIKWATISSANYYEIIRLDGSTLAESKNLGTTSTTNYLDTSAPAGTWKYKVTAYKENTSGNPTQLTSETSANSITISSGGQNSGGTDAAPGTSAAAYKSNCDDAYNSAKSSTSKINQPSLYATIGDSTVATVFKWILSLVNVLVLIFLLVVAFANILRIQIDTYAVKSILPSLIMGIVLANFSWLIVRFFIEFSTLLTHALVDGKYGSPGGLFTSIVKGYGINGNTICDTATGGSFATGLLGIFVGTVLILVAAILIFTLYLLFIARVWIITLLLILAPVAFLAVAFPMTKQYFRRWWVLTLNWIFMPPAALLILVLADQVKIIGQGPNFTRYILTTALLYFAIQVPFKMGGDWMRQWGNYVSQFKKKSLDYSGVNAARGAMKKSYEGYKEEAKDWAKIRARNTRVGQMFGRMAAGKEIRRGLNKKELEEQNSRDEGAARRAKWNTGDVRDQARQEEQLRKELEKKQNELKTLEESAGIVRQREIIANAEKDLKEMDDKGIVDAARTAKNLADIKTAQDKITKDLETPRKEVADAESKYRVAKGNLDVAKISASKGSFEAREARISMIGSAESAKTEGEALFNQSDEGKKILDQIARYATMKDTNAAISEKERNESVQQMVSGAKRVADNNGLSVFQIQEMVRDNFHQKDLSTLVKNQIETATKQALTRSAEERLAAHNYEDAVNRTERELKAIDARIKTLNDQITVTTDATLKDQLQVQRDALIVQQKKVDQDNKNAVMQRDAYLKSVTDRMGTAGKVALPANIREMFEYNDTTKKWEIKKMKGSRFTQTARVVAGAINDKSKEHSDSLTAFDINDIIENGTPTGDITATDFQNFIRGNYMGVAPGKSLEERADITRKIKEYLTAREIQARNTRDPQSAIAMEGNISTASTVLGDEGIHHLVANLGAANRLVAKPTRAGGVGRPRPWQERGQALMNALASGKTAADPDVVRLTKEFKESITSGQLNQQDQRAIATFLQRTGYASSEVR